MAIFDPLRTLKFQLRYGHEAKVRPLSPADAALGLLRLSGAGCDPHLEWQGRPSRVPDFLSRRRTVLHGDLPRMRTPMLVGNRCSAKMAERSVDWSRVQTRS